MTDDVDALYVSTPYRPAETPAAPAKGNGGEKPLPKLVPIRFVKGEVIPPREWTVPHWIPEGTITLLQDPFRTLSRPPGASFAPTVIIGAKIKSP